MVFSLFKKDPKRGKPGPRPKSTSKPSPASGDDPGTPTANGSGTGWRSTRLNTERRGAALKDLERQRARETSAKIDKIESEMARALATGGLAEAAAGAAPATVAAARPPQAPPPPAGPQPEPVKDVLEENTDTFMNRANAIEITNLGAGPVIDEAAICFANDQAAQAEVLLRGGIERHDLGNSPRAGWRMLLELLNQRSDRSGFEQLAQQYARQFGETAPAWHGYRALPAQIEPVAVEDPVVRLPADLDAGVVVALERLKQKAATERALLLDAGAVKRVDAAGAELLLRVLAALRHAPHTLKLYGAPMLAAALRAAVHIGRRDASDACWMLRLELLRIARQAPAFEEVAIDYCTTYEVSPPSWEPAPPNLTLAAGSAPPPPSAAATEPAPVGPLHWVGVVEGDGMPWFGHLASEAAQRKLLRVDCLHLKRLEFRAGSALLSQVMRLQQSGVALHFDDVNPLIAALLQVLGIGEVAQIHPRR